MKRALVFLFVLYCFSNVYCRVSVSPDGTLHLGPSTPNAPVKFEGEFVINGRSLSTELSAIDTQLAFADTLNLFRVNALRYQKLSIPTPRGARGFQINGVTYLAIATGTTSSPVYYWNTTQSQWVFLQNLLSNGNNNEFEFAFVPAGPALTDSYFLIDGPTAAQAKIFKFQANGQFDTGTAIGLPTASTREWKFGSSGGNYYLAHASNNCIIYKWNTGTKAFEPAITTGQACNDWAVIPRPDRGDTEWQFVMATATGTQNWVWTGATLTVSGASISPEGNEDIVWWKSGNTYYMACAEQKSIGTPALLYSQVFKMDSPSTTWSVVSNFQVQEPKDLELWSFNNNLYLFVANYKSTGTRKSAELRKWNSYLKRFDLVNDMIPLQKNWNWEVVTPDNVNYYAYLSTDGSSYIYKLNNNL